MIRETIYKDIEENGPSTVIDIMSRTGFTQQQVWNHTKELERRNILHQVFVVQNHRRKGVFSIKDEYIPKYKTDEEVFTDTTRRCSKCGEWKPFDEFHKNKQQSLGIQNRCKDCNVMLYGDKTLTVLDILNYWNSPRREAATRYEEGPLDTPCLVWTRSTSGGGNGRHYGQVSIKSNLCRTHRLALIVKLKRHIKDGMTASHLCHNSLCVQPSHLVEETQLNNVRRSLKDGRPKGRGNTIASQVVV